MKATILYDEKGKIIAISENLEGDRLGVKRGRVGLIVPNKQHKSLVLDLSSHLKESTLLEIHNKHKVDIGKSRLIRI